MKIRCVKKTSKKTGNEYFAIILEIIDGVEKMVLLDKSEVALLKLSKVEFIQE